MEDETKLMQAKLELLKSSLDTATAEASKGGSNGARWGNGVANKPLTRGYVKGVLDLSKTPAAAGGVKPRPPQGSARSNGGGGTPASQMGDAPLSALLTAPLGAPPPSCSPSASPPPMREPQSSSLMSSSSSPSEAKSQAASNLQAAMCQQNEDAREVEDFLSGLKLERYCNVFFDQGLDSMDIVLEMQECHMREVGMAVGHILKLQKGIADRKPAPSPAAAAASAPSSMVGGGAAQGTQRRVSFTANAEEVHIPQAGAATSSPSNQSAQQASQSLAEGAFDEAESAASFQEALKAWREGRSAPSAPSSSPKAPGSFWSKLGESDVNLERCSTPVIAPKESSSNDTQTQQSQRDLAPSEEKLCCYNCYKQFWKQFAVERSFTSDLSTTPGLPPATDRKLLCSEACGDQWLGGMEKKAEARRKRLEQMEALKEAERTLAAQQADQTEAPPADGAVDDA